MVKASKGIRKLTRSILTRTPRNRGLSPLSKTFQKFENGEKAVVVMDPSVHGGMPHRRFQGLTGTIIGTQGRAYVLRVVVGKKPKDVVVLPEHLVRNKE